MYNCERIAQLSHLMTSGFTNEYVATLLLPFFSIQIHAHEINCLATDTSTMHKYIQYGA